MSKCVFEFNMFKLLLFIISVDEEKVGKVPNAYGTCNLHPEISIIKIGPIILSIHSLC